MLVERAGHIVEKEELLEKVWPGVFIEEGNLSRRIFNLRQLLGHGLDDRPYIETIPKRGYRFTAMVREDGADGSAVMVASEQPEVRTNSGQPRRLASYFFFAGAVALTAILGTWLFWPRSSAPSQKIMLAVLPFDNLSEDPPEDYFADGLTDEMITQLGQLQPAQLGVIARTSAMRYKNSRLSASQICRELGVNYLLEGSVRQVGQRVRITAQLIQGTDQTNLWAETYETNLTDILNTQRDIAERIRRSLQVQLLAAHVNSPAFHFDPEAYRKYLLGLNEFRKGTRDGIENAIHDFREAIAIDDQNPKLYAALAQAYMWSQPYYKSPTVEVPLAKEAALKALELDPTLAGAHVTMGEAHLLFDWDWKAAEAEYRKALDINPSSSEAQSGYANYLSTVGRHSEAVSHLQQAYLVDPLNVEARNEALWVYYFSGRMQQTVEQAQKTIEMEPQAGEPYALLALAYADLGQQSETVHAAENAARYAQNSPSELATAASALARAGQKVRARQLLEQALVLAKTHYVCRFIVAGVFADLGENEKALDSLQLAFQQRSS